MELTPKQVVRELDRYIIGQDEAKRAVAVALRNRYRRAQLPEELRDEIVPKNILMVGPTGVGKTEIARRLAKLVDAPFVKVEATKFTEVGYVGRDVESIIRDLVEASVRICKEKASQKAAQKDTEKVKLPLWLKITLGVLFGVLLAALILRMTVYKESLFMNYLTSLLLGLACAALFYTRRFRNSKKDGKLYSVITVLLAIMAVIYGGMGLLGLLTYFGIV